MVIIGCDYHPGFQQIAFVDTETGEMGERRLTHREEAERFYGTLQGRSVRVGMEASEHARWFERLLSELQGRTEFLTATIHSEPKLDSANHLLERNGALLRVHAVVCSKPLDTAGIVRDGDLSPVRPQHLGPRLRFGL